MDTNSILALTGLVTQAAGSITSADAQQKAGAAAKQAADIQAQGVIYKAESTANIAEYKADLTEWTAETNAMYARARALRVEAEAAATAEIIARSTSRTMGRATAAYAAAGVSGGSSLYVLNDIATEGQLQKDLAIYKGKVQATDIRAQSALDVQAATSQAAIYRAYAETERVSGQIGAAALNAGGTAAQTAANMAAGTTLMTGLGKVGQGAADILNQKTETGPGTNQPTPLNPTVMPSVSSIDAKVGY